MSLFKKDTSYVRPSDAELKQRLTPIQYQCVRESGTERPFENEYWDHHADGIYLDVVSGEPLFSSLDKFDSGTGWPSFSRALEERNLELKRDSSYGMVRTEVRSRGADSHLGHLFDDGPGPSRERFCMNSASLKFVPLAELASRGLGRYLFGFSVAQGWEIATLAGGCFWGMEDLLRKIPGVIQTQVGYTGGTIKEARYTDVKTGRSGHAETVQVLFDPKRVSFERILLHFFAMHDPTTVNQQGNDIGTQYRSDIFVNGPEQRRVAQATIARVEKSGQWGKPVVTRVSELGEFWRAEDDHQDYLVHNPGGYSCHYVRKVSFD